MNTSHEQERVGTPWVIAILALLVLLVLGLVLYIRMGVRIEKQRRSELPGAAVATVSPQTTPLCIASKCEWVYNE